MPHAIILSIVSIAGYLDVRFGRIPNRFTGVALLLGLCAHALTSGWGGLGRSVAGAAVGTVLLFPLFVLRALGGGDVKLVAALGAAVTSRPLLDILLLTLWIAAALAVPVIVWRWSWRPAASRLRAAIAHFWHHGLRPNPIVNVQHPDAVLLPFSFCVCLATWSALCLR
jgi:prepilin peptidase CpaA